VTGAELDPPASRPHQSHTQSQRTDTENHDDD